MRLSKKASWALYLSAIGIITALFVFLLTDLAHGGAARERLGYLGQSQVGILKADDEAQGILFFIDRAAYLAAAQAIRDLAAGGGFADEKPCGDYLGYASWQAIAEEPDAEGRTRPTLKRCAPEAMDASFTAIFNRDLQSLVIRSPDIPQSSYEVTLTGEGVTRVIGNARQPVDILIMRDGSARQDTGPDAPSTAGGRTSCPNTADRVLTETYLDGMKLWVPAQATCGGVYPVIVLLHGDNPAGRTEHFIGTGANADGSRGLGVEETVKHHIQDGRYPVILVEPVHHKESCAAGLWGADFDISALTDKVRTRLQQLNIQSMGMSVIGHGGATCCPDAGLNKVARAAAAGLGLKLYGIADGMCPVSGFPETAMASIAGGTVILHLDSEGTSAAGDTDYHAKLTAGASDIECDSSYASCKKAVGKEWYSLVARVTHDAAMETILREALSRFFREGPPAPEGEGLETWADGACAGFVQGSVPYTPDDKVLCKDSPCCMLPQTRAQVERTKEFLQPGQGLRITDGARSTEAQRHAFLDYLAGGAVACGPRGLPISKGELAAMVPNGATRDERNRLAMAWLDSSAGQQYKAIIMDISRYSGCRHVQGKAVDIQMKDAPYNDASIQALRNIMCSAGWANYGGEWWHYEYLTSGYQEAKRANRCYFGELGGRDGRADLPATARPGFA